MIRQDQKGTGKMKYRGYFIFAVEAPPEGLPPYRSLHRTNTNTSLLFLERFILRL